VILFFPHGATLTQLKINTAHCSSKLIIRKNIISICTQSALIDIFLLLSEIPAESQQQQEKRGKNGEVTVTETTQEAMGNKMAPLDFYF